MSGANQRDKEVPGRDWRTSGWGRRIFGGRAEWVRGLLIAGVAGLFLGALGPFGSYLNPSWPILVAYWVGVLLLGEVMFGLTVRPARRLAPHWRLPVALVVVAATILVALPLSAACHAVAIRLWPAPIGRIGLMTWYGQTLVVAGLMAVGHELAARGRAVPSTAACVEIPAMDGRAVTRGDFISRLPPHLGAELIALQMEDHYVRAHTIKGSALILVPLRQALEELAGVPGLRVHRSWWVAQRAVVEAVQDGRNMRLRLVNGLFAPVSRANVAAAREAQLFTIKV